jgi:hypothetical protein
VLEEDEGPEEGEDCSVEGEDARTRTRRRRRRIRRGMRRRMRRRRRPYLYSHDVLLRDSFPLAGSSPPPGGGDGGW